MFSCTKPTKLITDKVFLEDTDRPDRLTKSFSNFLQAQNVEKTIKIDSNEYKKYKKYGKMILKNNQVTDVNKDIFKDVNKKILDSIQNTENPEKKKDLITINSFLNKNFLLSILYENLSPVKHGEIFRCAKKKHDVIESFQRNFCSNNNDAVVIEKEFKNFLEKFDFAYNKMISVTSKAKNIQADKYKIALEMIRIPFYILQELQKRGDKVIITPDNISTYDPSYSEGKGITVGTKSSACAKKIIVAMEKSKTDKESWDVIISPSNVLIHEMGHAIDSLLAGKLGYTNTNPEVFSLNNEEFLKAYASDFYNRKIEDGEMYFYQHNFARGKEEAFAEAFSVALDPRGKRFDWPNTIKCIKEEIIKKYESASNNKNYVADNSITIANTSHASTSSSTERATTSGYGATAAIGNNAGTSAQQNSSSDTQNTTPGADSGAETANNTTQNTAAISNATAHAALASTSSERGYDNPFKPLADNEPSQRVSIEEKSQKEKAEKALNNRKDNDTRQRLTESTTLKQRIEPQKIITSAGTELPAESLEPHQPVARFDVSDTALLEPWLMRLKNKNAVQRLEEYFKITQEILDTCGLEDSKRLFAHPNLVKEAVCFAGHSLNGGMFKDAYLSPLKITYLSAASLAQEDKLPNEYYSVWTHDKETFSPTRLLLNIYGKDYDSPPKISGKNDSESSPKRLQPLFSILKSAQSPSFKRLGADLNHFLKDLKKEKSLNKDHIKNIMESFAAFSVQHSAPPGFLAANGKDEMTTVNSLDALKKSVKNVIENFEALKREDETLGEALEAQRTSEAVNNAQTQQKQEARQIASDRSLSAFFQENQRKAVEFKQNKEREDRETQYKKTVESQQSEIKKSILSRKLESDMFAYHLHNENKLALEQQASKKRAEEAKKLNDAAKKPALEGPNLSGARSASENNGALNGSGKNQSASALNEPSTSQGHLESVAENDSALNKELLIQTISSLPGAEQIERRDGDNIILDLKVDLHISNQTKIFNQKNDKDGTARLEVTVKPEKTKTVYSAHNTTSIEPENSATGPQLATLYSLNKSDAGIGIHIKGADGSEMKTAWPWKAFDNFNYTSPQKNILITTGAIPNGDQPQALPNSFSEASVKGNISFNSENDIEKSRIEKKQPQWPEAQKNLAQLYQESERHREKAKQEKRWADAENQRKKNEESRVSHERRDFLHKAAESRMVKNNLRETELKKSSNKNGVL
ncbi:hypothetical protein [Candidatus Williamhamiltonella defendens]|uniref:ATLF-like domain-containing protein n=1 Tax=Candidatus Williamhamiltonella defendens TaxID=138072 RepID=A0A2D3TD25_9ENTR|nr:hypothetical protein [Candidatus Hamiltonella defensa]ATW33668.1 hypothetical protein BJP43_04540 [Candidatus Hamiltonella defensa]